MIRTSIEAKRGCGYRKPGGIYIMGGTIPSGCGRLPVPLTVCPCCNAGIKPARGWTWMGRDIITASKECSGGGNCASCQLGWLNPDIKRYGLIWVGESFYPTPGHFLKEANRLGISRRVAAVPKGFVVGESYVCLAHRKAIIDWVEEDGKRVPKYTAGIFMVFKPTALEYVVKGSETPEEIESLLRRGFDLVKVVKDVDAQTSIETGLEKIGIE